MEATPGLNSTKAANAGVSRCNVIFCIPVFNDWQSAGVLLQRIALVAANEDWHAGVLFVDDGSTDPLPSDWPQPIGHLRAVDVLVLRRNVGHQRAIALGLTFIAAHCACDWVIVMDGDGEDRPEDALRLVERAASLSQPAVVFAKRARRTEGWMFRLLYGMYKVVHRALTGRAVEVGNFSVIPRNLLDRLVGVSEIWNHYAAAVYKSRLPFTMIPIDRGTRIDGSSHMNLSALVVHGLSAISVFGEEVGVRLFVLAALLMVLSAAGLFCVVGVRMFTELAIPGWATNAAGLLLVVLINSLLLSLIFIFIMLQTRSGQSFLPLRDFEFYIVERKRVFPPNETGPNATR